MSDLSELSCAVRDPNYAYAAAQFRDFIIPLERTILFHALGSDELELIKRSGWTQFPSRSREEPLFYPILTEEYATQVAKEAYVEVDGVGWVIKSAVSTDFVRKYDVQQIGASYQREYWIPAAELADLNRHLVGPIEVLAELR